MTSYTKEEEQQALNFVRNKTDKELDELIKDEMRRQGHKKFINFQGVEEDL